MTSVNATYTDEFVLRRSPLAIAPIVFIGAFAVRSVSPILDTTVLSVTVGLIVVTVLMFAGKRWAGILFQAFPIAVFASPAGREFAFNLSSTDNPLWRFHSFVSLISLGVSAVAAIFVARGKGLPKATFIGTGLGVLAGAAMIAGLVRVNDLSTASITVEEAEKSRVPVINLLTYGYELPDLELRRGKVFHAVLNNPSSLPHTMTIDALGLEVYVPAKRRAVLEINPDQLRKSPLSVYCSVGNHKELGMVTTLIITQ